MPASLLINKDREKKRKKLKRKLPRGLNKNTRKMLIELEESERPKKKR